MLSLSEYSEHRPPSGAGGVISAPQCRTLSGVRYLAERCCFRGRGLRGRENTERSESVDGETAAAFQRTKRGGRRSASALRVFSRKASETTPPREESNSEEAKTSTEQISGHSAKVSCRVFACARGAERGEAQGVGRKAFTPHRASFFREVFFVGKIQPSALGGTTTPPKG